MLIHSKQGTVEGTEKKSIPSGKTFYSFLGIPYAEPPINELRFQAPRPCRPWNGTLDATRSPQVCVQRDMVTRSIVGEEDCLYLNVHIPQKPSGDDSPSPVMVFIHGGGFEAGSGDEYSAEYLIEYGVILVTFNYRLNVFGFLNLGLPECPGNVGLKDQLLALKWVKENISAFGGDENNITIFGESAGSASVTYLMMSPLAKGLFHKAIAQSGTAFSPWAFNSEPLKTATDLATSLGYAGSPSDRKSLWKFLLAVPANKLIEHFYKFKMKADLTLHLRCVPSVEFDIDPELALLPEHPEVLLTKMTPIPLIAGQTDLEGLIIVLAGSGMDRFISVINKDSPRCFVPERWSNVPNVESLVGDKIRKLYFKDAKEITVDHTRELIELLSDINFNLQMYDVPKAIKQKDENTAVFVYRFSYEGELNLVKRLCVLLAPDCGKLKGSCHADELGYLFKMRNPAFETSPEMVDRETNMIDTLCRLWTNFAKYGNPTPPPFEIDFEWKQFRLEEPYYMNINNILKVEKGLVFEERFKVWQSITSEVESLEASPRLKL